MIQLHILSGKLAGNDIVVRQFPFTVGRGAGVDFQADDPGVWDRHVEFTFDRDGGFHCRAQPNATLLLNGEKIDHAPLRNGDKLQLGSLEMRFWLPRSPQKTMRVREILTWTGLIALFGLQLALVYQLLR